MHGNRLPAEGVVLPGIISSDFIHPAEVVGGQGRRLGQSVFVRGGQRRYADSVAVIGEVPFGGIVPRCSAVPAGKADDAGDAVTSTGSVQVSVLYC